MGEIETKFLDFIKRRLNEGHLSVTEDELCAGVLLENPEFRKRTGFRYAIQRLRTRYVINAIDAPDGTAHYFIGNYASTELRASLGLHVESTE